jgi:transcriptional regulator
MTSIDSPFAPLSEHDITRLVVEHPFAWLVTAGDGDFAATPLPIRPVVDVDGHVTELLGHFARRNPQVELLRRVPRTLMLFMGPHAYMSSSWLADRTRAPTWNYASAQFVVDIEFTEDPAVTRDIVGDLVCAMEAGRPAAWSIDDMGARYDRLRSGIIAFRAHIRERRVKFKLGQDERDAEYVEMVEALQASGERRLLEWMQRCNPHRAGAGKAAP